MATPCSPAHAHGHAPMVSSTLAGWLDMGSTQHSKRAHGEILITSGGSTPMLRHSTSATAVVFSFSFCRQRSKTYTAAQRRAQAGRIELREAQVQHPAPTHALRSP